MGAKRGGGLGAGSILVALVALVGQYALNALGLLLSQIIIKQEKQELRARQSQVGGQLSYPPSDLIFNGDCRITLSQKTTARRITDPLLASKPKAGASCMIWGFSPGRNTATHEGIGARAVAGVLTPPVQFS